MKPLTRAQSRQVDRIAIEQLSIDSLVLMENAGRAACDLLVGSDFAGPWLVVCGRGNNGGDGLVVARHALRQHIDCRLLLTAPTDAMSRDAKANARVLEAAGVPLHVWTQSHQQFAELATGCNLIVDALLGTGATGDPREPEATLIRLLNQHTASVVSLDVPSGLDCDTGQAGSPCVRADTTITFFAAKVGFLQPTAAPWTGPVHVADIGIADAWIEPKLDT
jgi:NAD(P)H-hydrate epimerase